MTCPVGLYRLGSAIISSKPLKIVIQMNIVPLAAPKIALSISLAVIAGVFCLQQSARADYNVDHLSLIPKVKARQLTASQIDEQILVSQKRLEASENSGRLPASSLKDLHKLLDRIVDRLRYFKNDGTLDDAELICLTTDLDTFKANIERSVEPLPDIARHRADLERRLSICQNNGRLKPQRISALRAELKVITDREAEFKSSDEILSEKEVHTLDREYLSLSSKLERLLPPLPDLEDKAIALRKDIDESFRVGSISEVTQKELCKKFDQIQFVEILFRNSDNSLTDYEILVLNRKLENLNNDLKRALSVLPKGQTSSLSADVRGHWAEEYIKELCNRGTIGGFPNGTFKPDAAITRAQFSAIAVKALNLPDASKPASFKDVPETYWAIKAIGQVSGAGLVTGFPDGSFRPEDQITRAQALVALAKALKNVQPNAESLADYKDKSEIPGWAIPSITKAASADIIVSYPDSDLIKPNEKATRAEIAALTYQTMSNLGEKLPSIRTGLDASQP